MNLRLRHYLMALLLHVIVFGFVFVGVRCSRTVQAPAAIEGTLVSPSQLKQMQAPNPQEKAEQEAQLKAAQRAKAEQAARQEAQEEAKAAAQAKAEQAAKEKAQQEAKAAAATKLKAQEAAQAKAAAEAKAAQEKAAQEAQLRAEQEKAAAQAKAEQAARQKAQEEAKAAARAKAEQAARQKAQQEAKAAAAKAEAEKAVKAKAEAEAKAKAKAAAEAKSKASQLARRKAELQKQLGVEGAQLTKASQSQWVAAITAKLSANWKRPPGIQDNLSCVIRVRLDPDGTVVSAEITQPSGNPLYDGSVQAAVLKSSPLPLPADPTAFVPLLNLTFTPEDLQ